MKIEGIIFDMDNTLLRSSIDFAKMKQTVRELLVRHRLADDGKPDHDRTVSMLITEASEHPRFTAAVEAEIWNAVADIEKEGMDGAGLEPGADRLLQRLHTAYTLTVLTNNAYAAAVHALEQTNVARYFALIVGRDGIPLKPSPAGMQLIMEKFAHIAPEKWLAVGDSWIDGKAAQDAGIPFVAYRADRAKLQHHNVRPIAWIEHLDELENYLS